MYEFKLLLGIAHFLQQCLRSYKTGNTAFPANAVDIFDRFCCVYGNNFLPIHSAQILQNRYDYLPA